jgi:hypothetical protein
MEIPLFFYIFYFKEAKRGLNEGSNRGKTARFYALDRVYVVLMYDAAERYDIFILDHGFSQKLHAKRSSLTGTCKYGTQGYKMNARLTGRFEFIKRVGAKNGKKAGSSGSFSNLQRIRGKMNT